MALHILKRKLFKCDSKEVERYFNKLLFTCYKEEEVAFQVIQVRDELWFTLLTRKKILKEF
jgi:hypothetical protein